MSKKNFYNSDEDRDIRKSLKKQENEKNKTNIKEHLKGMIDLNDADSVADAWLDMDPNDWK